MKVTYLEKEVRTFDFHPSVSSSFCHFRLYFAFNLQLLQCVLVGYQPCTSFFSLLLVQSRKEDRQLSGSAVVELAVTVLQRENQNNIRFSMIQKEISIFDSWFLSRSFLPLFSRCATNATNATRRAAKKRAPHVLYPRLEQNTTPHKVKASESFTCL
jgi:hypothetical protein